MFVIPPGYRDANETSLSCEIIVVKAISRGLALTVPSCCNRSATSCYYIQPCCRWNSCCESHNIITR